MSDYLKNAKILGEMGPEGVIKTYEAGLAGEDLLNLNSCIGVFTHKEQEISYEDKIYNIAIDLIHIAFHKAYPVCRSAQDYYPGFALLDLYNLITNKESPDVILNYIKEIKQDPDLAKAPCLFFSLLSKLETTFLSKIATTLKQTFFKFEATIEEIENQASSERDPSINPCK